MTRTRPRSILRCEQLERRDAPATLVGNTKVTYQDFDGDNVAVIFSKPILNAGNVDTIFGAGFVTGSNTTKQTLSMIALAPIGVAVQGVSITTSAIRSPVNGGDGFATVGHIDATGFDLGAVKIDGDLGRIRAGDATTSTSGLKGLTVLSLGRFGTNTGAPNLDTVVQGKLDFLTVKSDIKEASVEAQGGLDGRIGSVNIGGSLIGGANTNSGRIASSGPMGTVRIGGSVQGLGGQDSGEIRSASTLASVTIGGSLLGSFGNFSGRVESAGALGAVRIVGNMQGGSGANSGTVFSANTLAAVTIGGSLFGGTSDFSGRILSSGAMGTVRIAGNVVGGSASGAANLSESGFVHGKRIASITIGGSLFAGVNTTTGIFANNGAIRADDDIGVMLINGSVLGNGTNKAIISARGSATPTATTDVAIGSLRVLGRIELGNILAGFDAGGVARNADAQIGAVNIVGDWIGSNIVAGAVNLGTDNLPGGLGNNADNVNFGNVNDVKMSGMVKDDSLVSSRIASVTIGGQVMGTIGFSDHFGIVAENVGAVRIGGTLLGLAAGKSNDDFLIGLTGDLRVNEV
jgi:hypothetical protein